MPASIADVPVDGQREDVAVGHPPDGAQHRDDLVEHGVEGGVEVAEHRAAHRGEHGRLDVRRAGAAEQPGRWVEVRDRHGGGG